MQTDEFQLAAKQRFDVIRDAIDDVDDALSQQRADADRGPRRRGRSGPPWPWCCRSSGWSLSGALIVVALNRVVVGPIVRLGRDARRVAEGDLAHPVRGDGSPDLVSLGEDVDAMRTRILDEVDQLNAASADLARQADDLARSNADLEQFAYVASHDLQEPLRKVSSFCQLLQKRYADQLDERANEYIHYAVDGAKRMQDLINDLLSFSRVGRTTEHVRAGRPRARSRATWSRCSAPAIEDAQRHRRASATCRPWPATAGCSGATFQNLIGNALKFRGRGAARAWRSRLRLAADAAGDEWVVSVADNGIGIEPDYAEQIFTIFKRLHNKTEYAGTGIGLALAKKIVEFHGGRIWLAPTPRARVRPSGSPSPHSPPSREKRPPMLAEAVRPIEVLLVEDDEGDVLMTREALDEGKVLNRLNVVGDGVEAVVVPAARRATTPTPSGPTSSCSTSTCRERDGRQVLEEIKTDPDLRRIPIVVLTTSEAEEDVLRSYDLHANAYVTKPVDFDRFVEVIRQIDEFFISVVRLPGS